MAVWRGASVYASREQNLRWAGRKRLMGALAAALDAGPQVLLGFRDALMRRYQTHYFQ